MCDRLVKSADARTLKELWLTLIYIQRCKLVATSSITSSKEPADVEKTIQTCINLFPKDAQITYVAAQYFSLIVKLKFIYLQYFSSIYNKEIKKSLRIKILKPYI